MLEKDDLSVIYVKKDFVSENEIRWCPGCGDYGIFNALVQAFAKLNIPKENFVVISGIGCSSRLPYYCNTYGFHSLHGRALTIAMGVRISNPKLSIWVATGDGDALSIGGNHFIHTIRKNPNINILLFNNEIYGLTKGQVSPTSPYGKKTKTSPLGSIDTPINAIKLALVSGATFAARALATDISMMREIFIAAGTHKGIAIIELLTNCIIFNDGSFSPFEQKDNKANNTLVLSNNQHLIFGKDLNKGIIFDNWMPKVITFFNDEDKKKLIIHNSSNPSNIYFEVLADLKYPNFPLILGIFKNISTKTYEISVLEQEEYAKENAKIKTIEKLMDGGDTWII